MAIQKIETSEVKGSKGKKRGINEAATGLIMDIVQAQQYQKPTESTVRELASNAVDSQSEKLKALDILSGKANASDYFIQRDGALYADSNWDPSYYSVDHLDGTRNDVELIYKEGTGGGRCDVFAIQDYGVGIGKSRLEGCISLGFSSKRNRTDALGSFGLGAKVGLSTGADFYTIITVYNGVRYIVKVFSRKINSMIGALNLDTGEGNIPYTFSDGEVIYGERTDEKNNTRIEVPVMKHHKDDYIRAVETQLLYFDNVKFFIEDEEGERYERNFKAETLYNSKNLIISKRSPYSKPHVVVVKGGANAETETGVCYGFIDFKEMELQDMHGDIGIKCPVRQVYEDEEGNEIEVNPGVDITPSRESVRWTANTREFLKAQFGKAKDEATTLVEKELQQTDFLKWIDACKNITYLAGMSNSTIGRLSRIVDLNAVEPKFPGSNIKFSVISELFEHFRVVTNTKSLDKETGKYQVKRVAISGWNALDTQSFYLKTTNSERHMDCYIADQHGSTFTTIMAHGKEELTVKANSLITNKKLASTGVDGWVARAQKRQTAILNILKGAKDIKDYDTIVVPDDYVSQLEKIEESQEPGEVEVVVSDADRRKLEAKVVYSTFTDRYMSYNSNEGETYQRSKREDKFENIKNYTGALYYGNSKEAAKLQFACHILDRHNCQNQDTGDMKFHNTNYKILLVADNNKKHFKMHKHIDEFFGKPELVKDENDNVIGCNVAMDNAVIHWNTARKMIDKLPELAFMSNFGEFDEAVSDDYIEVHKYIRRYESNLTDYRQRFGMNEHYADFEKFLDGIETIQGLAAGEASADDIADKVKELSLPTGITGGLAVNTEKLEQIDKLRGYASTVKHLLNAIPQMTERNTPTMSMELKMEISDYLEWKKVKYEEVIVTK